MLGDAEQGKTSSKVKVKWFLPEQTAYN